MPFSCCAIVGRCRRFLLPLLIPLCFISLVFTLLLHAASAILFCYQFCTNTYYSLQMTRASNESAAPLTLGPAEVAATQNVAVPPQVALVLPPPALETIAVSRQADQPANGQSARGRASVEIPPASAPSTAQNLTAQLLSVQPNMTLDQLTGILNILAPDRHMRSVASNLLRSSQPSAQPPQAASNGSRASLSLPQPPPPPAASVPNLAYLPNPLTGPRISNPQRRVQPRPQRPLAQDIADILNAPSRKRSEVLSGFFFSDKKKMVLEKCHEIRTKKNAIISWVYRLLLGCFIFINA